MKKVIRFILVALASIIAILCLAVGVVIVRPEVLINRTTLKYANQLLAKSGVDVRWDDVKIQIQSLTWLDKTFDFVFQAPCVQLKESGFSACSPELHLSFATYFSRRPSEILQLVQIQVHDLKWKIKRSELSGVLNFSGPHGISPHVQFLAKGNVHLPDRSQAKFNAAFEPNVLNYAEFSRNDLTIGYQLDLEYLQKQALLTSTIDGVMTRSLAGKPSIQGQIKAQGNRWIKEVPQINLSQCKFKLDTQNFNLDCPADLKLFYASDIIRSFDVPNQVRLSLKLDLKKKVLIPGAKDPVEGVLEFKTDPLVTPVFTSNLGMLAQFAGVMQDFPEKMTLDSKVDLGVHVLRFQDLVKIIEAKSVKTLGWSIPAPFHVLRGKMDFLMSGKADFNQGDFPFQFKTDLVSQAQQVNLDTEGRLNVQRLGSSIASRLTGQVNLNQVQLVLPRIEQLKLPRLFPDQRFQKAQAKKSSKNSDSEFKYHFRVVTKSRESIRLLSHLSKSYVPIQLDISLSDATPLAGHLEISQFPVEMFRRTAVVDQFTLNFKDPIKESQLNGLIHLNYADYQMVVHLGATIDKPWIKVESNPPLPESQLYSALLFGAPLEDLDPDQSASIGNARAALANGAINLISLYVLASTPVQSVGYDPTTGVVSAKIRLGEGISLNLGKGTTSTNVGLRKRLGPHWTVETDVGNSADNRSGVVSAYLQWSRRY